MEPGQWKETKAASTAHCKEDARDWVPAPGSFTTHWAVNGAGSPLAAAGTSSTCNTSPVIQRLPTFTWCKEGWTLLPLQSFFPLGASYLPIHISVLGHTDHRATSHPSSILSNVGPTHTGYKGYLVRLWPQHDNLIPERQSLWKREARTPSQAASWAAGLPCQVDRFHTYLTGMTPATISWCRYCPISSQKQSGYCNIPLTYLFL